jgi:hypothetical protein
MIRTKTLHGQEFLDFVADKNNKVYSIEMTLKKHWKILYDDGQPEQPEQVEIDGQKITLI